MRLPADLLFPLPAWWLSHCATAPAAACGAGLFIPKVPSGSIPVLVGALGALVMPYNIYFHSSVVNRRCAASPHRCHYSSPGGRAAASARRMKGCCLCARLGVPNLSGRWLLLQALGPQERGGALIRSLRAILT